MDEELVPRDEARAALEARRELGADYEDDLVERFAERIEARLRTQAPARPPTQGLNHDQKTGIVIVSIISTIPLVAIASGSGLAAVVAVCVALVLVNFLALRL